MKRKTIISFLFVLPFLMNFCFAQSKIQGKVSDSKDQQKLSNATIMLLNAKDSILLDFTRSDENGNFSFSKVPTEESLLIVSYPKYGDFYTPIQVNQDYSNLKIGMTNTAKLLEEVIVTGRIPITIKGDTTEYDAGSFKVEKNAKVEDLLKVLPGITVDASGKITAQGKTVKKVLVDGEEFFGDDPKLVTRNIRSDMVDKVQVYEKQSEQAERTGVDDGNKEQTINVKLKEGSKNGIFGKALAGAGTDDYYNGQLMLNKFKGSQKISAYGLFGNNGETSLSWEDAQKYGSDSGVSYSDEGMSFSSRGDDFSGQGSIGVPKVINTGVNFFDKYKGDKHKINLSYKYGKIESDGNETTNRQNNLKDEIQFTDKVRNAQSDITRQRVNLKYDLKFDSLTTLTIQGNASKNKSWTDDRSLSKMINNLGDSLNSDQTNNIKNSEAQSFGLNAFLTKKFKKAGRSISLSANINRDENDGDGYLYSNVRYFNNGVYSRDTITDQFKHNKGDNVSKGAVLTYTEPLSKKFNLSLNYGLNKSDNNSSQLSYNRNLNGDYDILDNRFSNNYSYDRFSNNYKVALSYKDEKLRANFTNSINDDQLKQVDNRSQNKVERSFLTYNPSLNVGYNITKGKGFYFNYSGRNQLPSLSQIQPFLDNTDQLNLLVGNEDLKPSFNNNFNLNYNSFKILSGSYTYAGLNYSNQKDAFVQNITTESTGRSIYRWENLKDKTNQNFSLYAGYHFKLFKDLGIENSPRISFNGSQNYNFINTALNKVDMMNYNFTYSISRNQKKGFDFDVNLSPGYKTMTSSLQKDVNSNGFTFGSNGGMTYYMPKKFKVFVNYDYTYEAPTEAFDTKFDQLLIHPGVSKKFLKNESLEFSFIINDLLNQNKGFARSQSNSIFTQRRFDTIQRYYMLKLSWDFTKMFMN